MKKALNEWKKFLNESGFNRIMNILAGNVPAIDSVAFLTAANPYGEPHPREENIQRNKDLARWLRSRGLGFIRIRGRFGGPEKSFIVNNMMKDEAIAAGLEFEQEAVIWGEKMFDVEGSPTGFKFYYIEGDTVKQVRDIVLSGEDIQDREDFYSQERQSAGRKFVVPFFDEEYEIVTTEGQQHNFVFLPPLNDDQQNTHRVLIQFDIYNEYAVLSADHKLTF